MSSEKTAMSDPVHTVVRPRPICEFFVETGGVEYVCEVYQAYDGHVEDFGIYPLLEDGSKGEPVEHEELLLWEQVQWHYEQWAIQRFDDDVI